MSDGVRVAPLLLRERVRMAIYGYPPKTGLGDLNYKIKVQVLEKFTVKKLLAITLITLTLSGCKTTKTRIGAILGGVALGVVGSQIGSGKGRILSTGVGVVLGTNLGAQIGNRYEEHDRRVW